jgi:hypothetical protein
VTAFRIVQAEAVRQLPAKDNWPAKRVVHYTLEADGNETLATDFIKVDDPIPEVGSTIEAELGEQDNFDKGRRKLKRPQRGGGGGPRGEYRQKMHPEERRHVEFQSARRDALTYIGHKIALGKLEDFDLSDLAKITDALRRLDDPPAPVSDVPGDDSGLPSLNEPI